MRNLRAKRRIHMHTYSHIPTELRIMRADSPARLVELLRRDVFALKICAHFARTWRPHILGGVYEVNHTVHTYMTHIHIHMSKDMRQSCD